MAAVENADPAGEPVLAWLTRHSATMRQREVEFDDPKLEYRRLFSEVWGTFLLVLVAAGGGVIGATAYGGQLTLAMKALAPGVMVMGIIFFMGTISGAHLNPAVTLAFAVRRNFPWIRVPGYVGAQQGADQESAAHRRRHASQSGGGHHTPSQPRPTPGRPGEARRAVAARARGAVSDRATPQMPRGSSSRIPWAASAPAVVGFPLRIHSKATATIAPAIGPTR